MPARKKTLRRMPEQTRKLARLIGELESTARKLKNHMDKVWSLELDSRALQRINEAHKLALADSAPKSHHASKPIIFGDKNLPHHPDEINYTIQALAKLEDLEQPTLEQVERAIQKVVGYHHAEESPGAIVPPVA